MDHIVFDVPEFKNSTARIDFSKPHNFSDVIFIVQGRELHGHRAILSHWSPVFKAMFELDFKERDLKRIPLPGKNYDEMICLFRCIYEPYYHPITIKGNCKVLLTLAQEYQMDGVTKICNDFLMDNLKAIEDSLIYSSPQIAVNCKLVNNLNRKPDPVNFMVLAQQFGLRDLYKAALKICTKMNSQLLQKSKSLSKLNSENLRDLLVRSCREREVYM